MPPSNSIVYLIGAGPGDVGLLTLRGKELLATCDVVVYDYLANKEMLAFARHDAELIYAGKMGGEHTLPQQEINALLVAKAGEGKRVARLKGGDPYMFGRGAEEAEELLRSGIACEVVPGVTSAIAGPAYAGIPLTHRKYASSVCFATGHEDVEKAESVHDWKALATGTSTLVFFMGMKNLPWIVDNLVHNGMDPATPAALVYRGTTPDHRSTAGTLADLPRLAEEENFTAPSIIIIGKVVLLRDRLNWFEKKPLLGKGIIVTRAREQASDMARLLAAEGARVVELPAIRIEPATNATLVREAICHLRDYDWTVFTSPNGVEFFWRELTALRLDARAFAATSVAAIGPATAEALAQKGILADYIPQSHVAEALLEGIVAQGVSGKRILLARAEKARDILPKGLEEAGADVRVVAVYQTLPVQDCAKNAAKAASLFATGKIRYISFASSSTVENFLAVVPVETLYRYPNLRFACIGPITAKTLEDAGLPCHIMPEQYTIPALIQAIISDAESNPQ